MSHVTVTLFCPLDDPGELHWRLRRWRSAQASGPQVSTMAAGHMRRTGASGQLSVAQVLREIASALESTGDDL